MKSKKNLISALGALITLGLLAVAGALVVVPNYNESQELQQSIDSMGDLESTKLGQLANLRAESENIAGINQETSDLVNLVPEDARVDLTAAAVVSALAPGVSLVSFARNASEAVTPPEAPVVSVTPAEAPFSVAEVPTQEQENIAGFSQVPLVIEVTGVTSDSLAQTLDNMALQSRLLKAVAVDAALGTEPGTATIYAYAYTNTSATIDAWRATQ